MTCRVRRIPTPDQAVDANWIVVAAADYTGDSNTDFLWYNSTSGKLVTWYLNAPVVRTCGASGEVRVGLARHAARAGGVPGR